MAKCILIVLNSQYQPLYASPWWRHQMETFSALLAGNSPVPSEFPAQRPVTRSFDVFFVPRLNKRLSKQSWGWWFETLSRPLWRHCNDIPVEQPHIEFWWYIWFHWWISISFLFQWPLLLSRINFNPRIDKYQQELIRPRNSLQYSTNECLKKGVSPQFYCCTDAFSTFDLNSWCARIVIPIS